MKFLVTGANGYVGARIYQDLGKFGETYGTYHKDNLAFPLLKADVTNVAEIKALIRKLKPDVIVHAAAIPTPKLCMEDEAHAMDVNVRGTQTIVEAAKEVEAMLIHLSTVSAQEPHDVYASMKLESEKLVSSSPSYVILRPALILGMSPNTINDRQQNRLLNNIINKIPPVYDNSLDFQVTWAGHLSEIIIKAAKREINNEIIPVLSNERNTRFVISNDILQNFNIKCTIKEGVDTSKNVYATTSKLQELRLPVYNYRTIVSKTVKEMEEWLASHPSSKPL